MKVPNQYRIINGDYGSDNSYKNNGAFKVWHKQTELFCIASDGAEWDHVSVSRKDKKMPTWDQMNYIRNMFWSEGETVIQFHPKKVKYVNIHETCLHLWRSQKKEHDLPGLWMV